MNDLKKWLNTKIFGKGIPLPNKLNEIETFIKFKPGSMHIFA